MKTVFLALMFAIASSALADHTPYRFNRRVAVELIGEVTLKIEKIELILAKKLQDDPRLVHYTHGLTESYNKFSQAVQYGRPIPNLCYDLNNIILGFDRLMQIISVDRRLSDFRRLHRKAREALDKFKRLEFYFSPWCSAKSFAPTAEWMRPMAVSEAPHIPK